MARKLFFAALPLLIIIAVSFFAVRPLFVPGFFNHHDDQQVARLFQLNKALSDGQIPPRLVPDLGFGLGYAVFNFYPPLSYYMGEAFYLLGIGYIDSIKLVWMAAILGAGISMYFLARKFFGPIGSIVSALFYVYLPYHAIDAYVRGALAELFSFVWLPLVLLFSNSPVICGIFLALLMLTHNLIFLPFIGFYVLWSRNIKNILISVIIAFGLTSYFWIPSLWEKQFTLVDDLLTKNLASYKIHYVCPPQLWESLWGYGGSVAGCVDGMSFKLGKLHIILSLLAIVIAVIPAKAGVYINRFRLAGRNDKIIFMSFILFILSVFMTTQYSNFIWDNLSVLWYLQFPWRFLEFAGLFSSLLAGSIFVFKNKLLNILVAVTLVGLLLLFNVKLFRPQTYLSVTDTQLTSDMELKQHVSSTSFEYLPKGSPITAKEYYVSSMKYDVLGGTFEPKSENFKSNYFEISGTSTTGGKLQINIANFPGWKVWVNDKNVQISDNNKYKLIEVGVPSGESRIIGKFENTPVRTIGNAISLLFVAGLLVYGYKRIKK